MQFVSLLVTSYIVYYTINILFDLAKSRGNRSSNTKVQPVEFAISAPAPAQSVYADTQTIEKQPPASANQPQPKSAVSDSNDPVTIQERPSNNSAMIYESDKAIFFKPAENDITNPEPAINIISALDLEIISEGIEVTEEQVGLYAIPY